MIKNILIAALSAALILRAGIFTFQSTAQLVAAAGTLLLIVFITCEELDELVQDWRDKHRVGY